MTKGDSSTECESSALVCPSMIGTTRGSIEQSMLFSVGLLTKDLKFKDSWMNAASGSVSQAPKQKMLILVERTYTKQSSASC